MEYYNTYDEADMYRMHELSLMRKKQKKELQTSRRGLGADYI